MIAIGVGCRKGCPDHDLVTLVREALAQLPDGCVATGLFSHADKRGEPALHQTARVLGVPLTFFDREALQRVADRARTISRRVEERFGVPSVAETAALAGAGERAVLLVARRVCATASCAIAGPPP